jgi:hypothetical protein
MAVGVNRYKCVSNISYPQYTKGKRGGK